MRGSLAIHPDLPYARYPQFRSSIQKTQGKKTMKNPLDSIWGTIISGLVLTLILYWFAWAFLGATT